jgi:hypothetical protein
MREGWRVWAVQGWRGKEGFEIQKQASEIVKECLISTHQHQFMK